MVLSDQHVAGAYSRGWEDMTMLGRRTVLRAGLSAAATPVIGALTTRPRFSSTRKGRNWDALRSQLSGDLVLPTDSGYANAKHLATLEFDSVNPRGIAYCQTERDVRACLRFAQDNDLPFTPRSGGHSLVGWSTIDGLVVDLSRLEHVISRPEVVRIGPGAQAVDVMERLGRDDLQLPAGLCPTVCSGGFTTGGGIGWLTRKFGLSADRMVSARIVLANGRVVECSEQQHPDLFWALRGGGGGNFGIVTDFVQRPVHAPRIATFDLSWSYEHAPAVLKAWQQWIMHGSDNIGTTLNILLDDAKVGATPTVLVGGGYLGSPDERDAAVNELISAVGTAPANRTADDLTYRDAMMRLWGCTGTVEQCHLVGDNPEANLERHEVIIVQNRMFDEPLPRTGVDDALGVFEHDRRAGQFHNLAAYAVGGAANRVGSTETAYVHRNAQIFLSFSSGFTSSPEPEHDRAVGVRWVGRGMSVLGRYSTRSYVNFPDLSLPNWQDAYYGDNYPRLLEVKRTYDPYNVFRREQSIGD